ncbi:hypothetical protein [Candidatus Synchoanobacter obligatus]|uniref:Uncharacterized protein n=1 Tax=Candidatus Synchoanobacter obligatus TaxID=2919597 RepID=A0ABT1L625_9GAMM|nr:hypothetical protein [Candidatus Synchoanobacter obligatus]MCP8352366.1 hypothetical protein [Candidatus Synchoanobacter obligatus]
MSDVFKELSGACIKYAKTKEVSFTFKHKSLSPEEVFATFGILPAMIKRASKVMSVCLSVSLCDSYPKEERSYLGYTASITSLPLSTPLVMLFIIDVLEEVIAGRGGGEVVALDEFGYEE